MNADAAYRIAKQIINGLDKPSAITGLFLAGVAICWVILPLLSR